MRKAFVVRVFCVAIALWWPGTVHAQKILFRVKASNPSEKPQTVNVRSDLPAGIGSNDVLNTSGLELGYDVRSGAYYVHSRVALSPKEIRMFNVELRDIWAIPEVDLDTLLTQATALSGRLDGKASDETVTELRTRIEAAVQRIRTEQAAHAISTGAKPVDHIRAYEVNRDRLIEVRRDVGKLENMVLEQGQDPGRLIGLVELPVRPRRTIESPADERVAVFRVSVSNTSATVERPANLRRDLPAEIGVGDIMDAGGLDFGVDPRTGLTYVHKPDLVLKPGEARIFEVRIRDQWNVNGPRVGALIQAASNLLERIGAGGKYASVEQTLRDLMGQIDAVAAETGPEGLGEAYVAFYRDQARRLDALEAQIDRIESVAQPINRNPKYGFDVKPPSMKTTWIIIYVILGFLALLSLLFFLRWYGKGKSAAVGE